jgi:glucan-binding YG repeat protein
VTAIVESVQTPHQLGWYDLGNITYYLEINENASATTGWTRGAGVTSPNPVQMLSTAAPSNATWYVRAVAANPLGEGDPGEVV